MFDAILRITSAFIIWYIIMLYNAIILLMVRIISLLVDCFLQLFPYEDRVAIRGMEPGDGYYYYS